MSSPANKLSLVDVQREFAAAGCTLLETEYHGNKIPMRFICSCGMNGSKNLVHFRRGAFCKACGYANTGTKNGRLTLEKVASVFREKGCTLLASEYKCSTQKLPYLCKCGTFHAMSHANFVKGKQCPECAGKKQWTLETAKAHYAEQGCELLATEYEGMTAAVSYRCSCGKVTEGTFSNFYHRNARCRECGVKKNSGPNAHQYKPEKTDEEREVQRKFPAYAEWRKQVYARDRYTCQVCGAYGTKINAHHLDNYADHKESRVDVANGVTLCKPCHVGFHSMYGQKTVTTKEQFTQFKETHHG